MADIWVFAEYKEGTIRRVTFEALSAARRLADEKGLTVSAVVFGSGVKDESLAPLAHYGADKVIVLDDASLENYTSDAYGHALLELIEKHAPKMLMFVNSSMGIDLAPVLAESLNVGLITDVLAIEESGDTLSVRASSLFRAKCLKSVVL